MNRGLARRPLFEDKKDIRFFLSRLAREVRQNRIEVHAWCALTTHYHLLLKSPRGELSTALRNTQNSYTKHFNRRHKRDGTLIRGRFTSKRVKSIAYRRLLVGYINRNPHAAGLDTKYRTYPFSSAYQWASNKTPRWLSTDWVTPEAGVSILPDRAAELIEGRARLSCHGNDDLDHLIHAAPSAIQTWLQRQALLADGSPIGQPVCDRSSILQALETQGSFSTHMAIGLLRSLARLPWKEIAEATGHSSTSCHRLYAIHKKHLQTNPTYSRFSGVAASQALSICLTGAGKRGT